MEADGTLALPPQPQETRREDDSQDALVYTRPDAAASCGTVCHGCSGYSPPHARVPRPLPESPGAVKGLCRHQERRAAAVEFGHWSDGGIGLESDLSRRQGAGAYGRKVW